MCRATWAIRSSTCGFSGGARRHLPRSLSGACRCGEFWNANIFHPEPLALAFSEHLFGAGAADPADLLAHRQSDPLLQPAVPRDIRAVRRGHVSAGPRMLDGDRTSVAGQRSWPVLIYAFVPYRIAQVAHIQSLSSQWMPFALYGFGDSLAGPSRSAADRPRRRVSLRACRFLRSAPSRCSCRTGRAATT